MPRKSFAALATPTPIAYGKPHLAAPERLTDTQSAVWRQIVDSLAPGFFGSDVGPMLERYCVHVARCRRIETLIAEAEAAPELDLAQFERLTRMARAESAQAASLARALRITNQSKHPVTAGRMAAMPGPTLGIEALSGVRHGDN